mmetsp:Transcript_42904/g.100712  ORF Transcript_42904/g.100712 Transcript_42904/m.100712 type:complete len:1205 (-) Transcript_42904:65-3679(-)
MAADRTEPEQSDKKKQPEAGQQDAGDGPQPPPVQFKPKCKMCYGEVVLSGQEAIFASPHKHYYCERCQVLMRCPHCTACGEPVRTADRNDPEPYHKECRRCSSCFQVVTRKEAKKIAGRLLCPGCSQLFHKFFLPKTRSGADHVRDAFRCWDQDGSGVLEKDEVRRVIKALDPNFADRDLDRLFHEIDENHNNVVDIDEFMNWLMSYPDSLGEDNEDSFASFVTSLMRESGGAKRHGAILVSEVICRPDGLMFIQRSGDERMETLSIKNDQVQLTTLDAEEVITALECNEDGLYVTLNTGREALLKCKGSSFGPFKAPLGFYITGLRTKPTEKGDRVVGVSIAPCAQAKTYNSLAALHFAAEQEFLQPLRELLSKAVINVNGFDSTCGNVSALMLAAANGAVGAMRMLLTSKANPDLEDDDGWTALTFASECGQKQAVNVLLEQQERQNRMKSKEILENQTADDYNNQPGLTGSASGALAQALRNKHNAIARMLLRAGLGSAPKGTFAVEEVSEGEHSGMSAPIMTPPGGAYARPVTVKLVYKGLDPKIPAKPTSAAKKEPVEDAPGDDQPKRRKPPVDPYENELIILYSLDGRDPMLVGKRYMGPFTLTDPRTCVRAVARKGPLRSPIVEATYTICNYVVPEESVSGEVRVRTFPEALPAVKEAIATTLVMDSEAVHAGDISMAGDDEAAGAEKEGRWLWLSVQDKRPTYRLNVDCSTKPWVTARVKKRKKFQEDFIRDIGKAVGEKPGQVILEDLGNALNVNHFYVDFALPFELGEALGRQLTDAASYLVSRSSMSELLDNTELVMTDTLADLIQGREFLDTLKDNLCKTASTKGEMEMIGIASKDGGVLAMAGSCDNIKRIKKVFEKGVQKAIAKYNFSMSPMQEGPEYLNVRYVVDISGNTRTTTGKPVNGGNIAEEANQLEFLEKVEQELLTKNIAANMSVKKKAEVRAVSDLEVHLTWRAADGQLGVTDVGAVQKYLDAVCLFYADKDLLRALDVRTAQPLEHCPSAHLKGPPKRGITQSFNVITPEDTNSSDGHPTQGNVMRLDLPAIPLDVSEVFFILSAFETDSLKFFADIGLELYDYHSKRLLMRLPMDMQGKKDTKSLVMGGLTRVKGAWIFNGMGMPSKGTVKGDLSPVLQLISDYQGAGHSNWARRGLFVRLRVMSKLRYAQPGRSGETANLLRRLLLLPTPAFQLVVMYL